ncbi:unnamed protein product [Phytophthora lilii]|uniref:Unnamed protein product n=1 Tax=Phytophthora lilii TaxID=2077276 RepID=A0A9W6UA91_9STRA|nr:unnamed protein product [Phytophthora lilii]
MGSVRLTGIDGMRIKIADVLYIPGLDRQLLFVSRLAERGMSVEFQQKSCTIWNNSKAIALGKKVGKAYVLDCEKDMAQYVEYAGIDTEWELWHARMGHLNMDALAKTQRATTGMPVMNNKSMALCGGCMKGKLGHLRVFGSVGYAHVDKAKRNKLEPKSFKCMFLGYADTSKGYRVYDLESNKVKVTRSMKLDERKVNGIYDSAPKQSTRVIQSTEDVDDVVLHEQEKQHTAKAPTESVAEDHEENTEMPEAESSELTRDELATYRRTPFAAQ